MCLAAIACAVITAPPPPDAPGLLNLAAQHNTQVERIPEDQRAWPLYAKASALLELCGDPTPKGSLPFLTPDWDEYTNWLQDNETQQVVRLFHDAAMRPRMGMPVSIQTPPILAAERSRLGLEPIESSSPHAYPYILWLDASHMQSIRSSARLLCSQAVLDMQLGNPDAAADHIIAAINSGSHGPMPPLLLGQLVETAAYTWVSETITHMLSRKVRWDDRHLASIQHRLMQIDPSSPIDMRWEHQGVVQITRQMYEINGSLVENPGERFEMLFGGDFFEYSGMSRNQLEEHASDPPTLIADLAYSLTTIQGLQKYSAVPPWKREFRWQNGSQNPIAIERLADPGTTEPPYPIVSVALQANYSGILNARLCAWARINAAIVALALNRHQLRHDTWPKTIDAVDPELLEQLPSQYIFDPFTGNPLLYKLTDVGPVVYSTGPDRDDDDARPLHNPNERRPLMPRWIPDWLIERALENDPETYDGDWVLYPPQP